MRISIELVPRSPAGLDASLATLRASFPAIDTVNIPDLVRFPFRSWHACARARQQVPNAIPHLRARDFAPHALEGLKAALAAGDLREVLVVRGDPRSDPQVPEHPTSSAELIAALRAADPDLTIYAAIDPYRRGARDELDDAQEKRAAGADGFFTQPVFDLRLAEWWADALGPTPVFWGVTAITSRASQRYWEEKNRVVLPSDFEAGLAWSRRRTGEILDWARRNDFSCYAMPIRVELDAWPRGPALSVA